MLNKEPVVSEVTVGITGLISMSGVTGVSALYIEDPVITVGAEVLLVVTTCEADVTIGFPVLSFEEMVMDV